ncbi:hypothetical protein [Azohydromonas caseinilytica]|uniref:BON domain-containing protein n=1 Tax=Azohydromonas caseinilytica TaxID=2728836 RepID=A0A848FH52_9BURK|nr:hypothetical protein [Azohydromonas caseinilytica]NML18592.1 hypothetical protein [Azohydromonas caseinilytica]
MRRALTALGTLAAGVAAAYFSDPGQGRRRRAALRHQAAATAHDTADVAQSARQQAADRLQELAHESRVAGRQALHRLRLLVREGRERMAARRLDREPPAQRPVASGHALLAALGGIAVGAAAMVLLDPQRRRRRLSLVRDQAVRLGHAGACFVDVGLRDLGHRAKGLGARTTALLRRSSADDAVLVQRVRAAMGRVVSHPHSIWVTAAEGCVTIGGPVLDGELAPLLKCVHSVRGVREVRDALEPHDSAAHVPALQGGRRRVGPQAELMRAHWAPGPRLLALAGGTALTLYGASRGGLTGLLSAAAGLGLAVRAARNEGLRQAMGRVTGRSVMEAGPSPQASSSRQEADAAGQAHGWRPVEPALPLHGGAALH